MPNFHYQAWNAERQSVAGELQAETVRDAIAELEARGLSVQSIGYGPAETILPRVLPTRTDVNAARTVIEQTILRTHLAKVLAQGKTIVPALRAFSEELPIGSRRNELQRLIRILESGDATAAEQAFDQLPDYWIPLLSAAISSTDPGRILQEFLRESNRADELRRQWWLMLSYPLLICCAAGGVLVFLSLFVIPIFRDIFLEFNLELPWLTSLTLTAASWIAYVWPFMLIALILLTALLLFRSSRTPQRPFGSFLLLSAIFGRATAIARLSQFMADFLEAGLSIPDTLKVAGLLTNKHSLRQSVWTLADTLQHSPGTAKQIDAPRRMAAVYHALRTEMPTRLRIRLLREIARDNAEIASRRFSWTRGMVEPVAIVFIGFIVATVVVSLFIPLIKLIEGLSK